MAKVPKGFRMSAEDGENHGGYKMSAPDGKNEGGQPFDMNATEKKDK